MTGTLFEAVFGLGTPDAGEVARCCVSALGDSLRLGKVLLNGRPVDQTPVDETRLQRKARRQGYFVLEGNGRSATWGEVKNFGHALLSLSGYPLGAVDTLLADLNRDRTLILARLADEQYDYWQNAEDPLLYEAAGRSTDGLPLRSNELPRPLERMVVDISGNPGRRVLRHGYVEAIGHRMWLGPLYFSRVPGALKVEQISSEMTVKTNAESGSFEVWTSETPFVDVSTAHIQDRLRRLIFPTAPGPSPVSRSGS